MEICFLTVQSLQHYQSFIVNLLKTILLKKRHPSSLAFFRIIVEYILQSNKTFVNKILKESAIQQIFPHDIKVNKSRFKEWTCCEGQIIDDKTACCGRVGLILTFRHQLGVDRCRCNKGKILNMFAGPHLKIRKALSGLIPASLGEGKQPRRSNPTCQSSDSATLLFIPCLLLLVHTAQIQP